MTSDDAVEPTAPRNRTPLLIGAAVLVVVVAIVVYLSMSGGSGDPTPTNAGATAAVTASTAAAPTSAAPTEADLALTASGLAFGPASGGSRDGSLTLTVKNLGPASVPYDVSVTLPNYIRFVPQSGCRSELGHEPVITMTCARPPLAAGASAALTLMLHATAEEHGTPPVHQARVAISDSSADPGAANNTVDVAVTFA